MCHQKKKKWRRDERRLSEYQSEQGAGSRSGEVTASLSGNVRHVQLADGDRGVAKIWNGNIDTSSAVAVIIRKTELAAYVAAALLCADKTVGTLDVIRIGIAAFAQRSVETGLTRG
jgi:hypothetical protein